MTQTELEPIWVGPPPLDDPPTVVESSPDGPTTARTHTLRLVAIAVAAALIGALGGAAVTANRLQNANGPKLAVAAPTVARRGVVEITTSIAFGRGRGAGTGMLLTPTGQVLTNNHVINGATEIAVQINGTGRAYEATVIGTDATHDVALLQLADASGLTTIRTADSSTLKVGDPVTAIGNAQGQPGPPTVATGVVTALNQSITAGERGSDGEDLAGLIQTNVPLQPGDSGGPLTNANSQVVGINTAASTARTSAVTGRTQGFAIPIEQAMGIAKQIQAGRASATIRIGPPAFLGIGLATAPEGGAAVLDVQDGTPAATAGLEPGDRIVMFDGQTVRDGSALRALIDAHKPGDRVSLAWVDAAGGRQTATVKLAAGPPR